MTTNILVTFYSTYGHVHRMALAVAEGAESVPDTTVRLRRIAELEEARKALSAQDAYVRAQQAQAGAVAGAGCAKAGLTTTDISMPHRSEYFGRIGFLPF